MSQAQNKVFVAMVGVVFHEMPKNRTRTNVYHGLGNTFRIFTEAHSQSSAEQYNLHESLLWRWGNLNQEGANFNSSAQQFFRLGFADRCESEPVALKSDGALRA